ncbi:MAG: tetratricopeptide repeat protein [Gemmatimonadales bacterium]|nr:tetratricopeptide repeat protein [Gemmatimonadales bacterium]
MKKLVVAAGVVTGLVLSAGQAEGQGVYQEPGCDLKTGHFLVNSSVMYLKGASEEADSVKRARMLRDAHRNLFDAVSRGEADNPAVWYFLGRYYALTRDAVGADSAFDRAEQLQPDCAEDIAFHRQVLWVPVMNQAIDSLRVGAFEGSKDLLRAANAIHDKDNLGFYYLARIFANEGETDSALHYFKRVVEVGVSDTARQENYNEAVYNTAVLYGMLEQWDSAAVWYGKYREIDPNDSEALTGLAQAYQQSGQPEAAMELYDLVLSRAPEMAALDLFRTGEALFRAERFQMAARAFDLGLDKAPGVRSALYNLTNTYLAIADDEEEPREEREQAAVQMELAARRLVAVDPHNSESLRLLAASFQLQRKDDSTLATLEHIAEMTFDVVVDRHEATEGGYSVQGRIVNLKDAEATFPTIMFEFLDAQGTVITTDSVAGGTLGPHDTEPYGLVVGGEGIVAYRYKVGS